jgi:tetratricopeptide (TPR) repeat protein
MNITRPAQATTGRKSYSCYSVETHYDEMVTVPDSPQRSRSIPRIWEDVPPRNKNFTGRGDVLEQLRRRMAGAKATALLSKDSLPTALQGLGGVGKTAVAIEYAHEYSGDYDLVCWIRADQIPLVRASLARLASALHLDAPSASGIDLATASVLDALRRGEPYDRWLVVFDNADRPDELIPYLPSGPGDVLITSRNHDWRPIVDTIALDVFDRAESIEFLLKRIPKGLTEAAADQLADKLGDLPLALVQAAGVIYEGGMAVGEYLRQLDERVARILAQGTSPEVPTSMTAAWQISVLKLRQQSPQALELLRCCAFLGPEPIPTDVFKLGSQESLTGVGAVIADPIDLSSAISTLGRYALVKKDGAYIAVHRLIQALLRAELDPDQQYRYRQDAHSILAAGAPGNPTDVKTWPQYRDLVAHVGSLNTDLARCQVAAHRSFALDVVRYLYLSGDFESCRLFAQRFIEQWTIDSGPADAYVLDARRHLGNALRELGEAEVAYQIIESTLRSAEQVLEPRNHLTLHLRNAFGADLRARGEFVAALSLDEDTRALHEEVFGPYDPQTLRVMNNLALDYGLNSDFPAARDLHKQVFVRQRDAKPNIPAFEVLNSLTGLARAVRLCGSFSQARDLGLQAYSSRELRPEHYLTLRAATDLSIAMRRIPDDHDEALEIASETWERCKRFRGDLNPDTMAAAISLSNLLRAMGRIAPALELAAATERTYPHVYGAEHPYNYGSRGNLALLRRLAGDYVAACQLDESALAGLDARLGRDHFFSLTVAVNLASDLAALGRVSSARALGEDSLARLIRLLGEDHPLTLCGAANLVLDLRADGADEDADVLSAVTTDRCERSLGPNDPLTEDAIAGRRSDVDFDPPPI